MRATDPPAAPHGSHASRRRPIAECLWITALAFVGAFLLPRGWARWQRFEPGPDYRIPYQLSRDYWLYDQRLTRTVPAGSILALGDSVIWGEYVAADGTLTHFLNEQLARPRFVNAGINGLFPLALDGLVASYGDGFNERKVLLHCNLLWLSSPEADLSATKEQRFNHPELVPQFRPRIPCYGASLDDRLAAVAGRELQILQWSRHLQVAFFGGSGLANWTLGDNGAYPPAYPNSYRNPFSQIRREVPDAPAADPDRGENSPRHKPWSTTGQGTQRYDWVHPDASLQWRGFRQLVAGLKSRRADVRVVVGPFNEHLLAPENRPEFQAVRDRAVADLRAAGAEVIVPALLPSELYGDASHPLTDGYRQLAKALLNDPEFRTWATEDHRQTKPGG